MIKAKISPNASVVFEEQCYFHETSEILGYCQVGAFSYFGQNCIFGEMKIGRFCSIAPGVKIGLGEHDVNYVSTHPFFFNSKHVFNIPDGIGVPRDLSLDKYKPPVIGNDVWIGANAVICRGVTIGDGAVIAAGAVVTKNVEPYSIVGGTPAKHIKFRFDENIIRRLLAIKWWDLDLSNFVGLDSSNVEVFLNKLEIKKSTLANYNRVVFSKMI